MKFGIRILMNLAAAAVLAVMAFPATTCRGAAINVDVIGGTVYNGTAAAPDAGTKWNAISGLGTLATVYDSQTNLQSGATITLTSSSGTSHIYNDTVTGNPTPSALMSAYTYSATYTLAVSNLTPNQAYILYAYSHGNVDNQTGTVTFSAANGGASASTSQTGNSSNFRDIYLYGQGYDYVVLNGTSDNLGTITFSVVNYLNGFQLVKVSAPVITGLANQTTYIGNTVVLSPFVSGFPTPSLQWLQNGVALSGQTNSMLTLIGVQPNLNGNVYSLTASNSVAAVTNTMTLIVSSTAPALPAQTLNVNVVKNSSTHYTGTGVASDTGTYWNNFVVPTTTNASTLLSVSNSFAAVTTNSIIFTQSSGNFNVYEDASSADGNPLPVALMEDYIFNGGYTVTASNLMQGTYMMFAFAHGNATGQGSTVTVNAANGGASGTTTDTGYFRDIFQTNAAGNSYLSLTGTVGSSGTFSFTTAYLNGFQLQLLSAPIVIGPTNQTVVAGTTALVSPMVVTGVPPPSCQWFSNSVAIAGATNTSLTLNNVQYAQNGTMYSITASNPVGTVTSLMTLSVIVTPAISGLNNQTVTPGSTVTIAPAISGVPSPTLQWQFNGTNLTNGLDSRGSTISGSTISTLNITNAQIADTGTYSLIASNSAGLVTNSMTLTVSSGTIAPAIAGLTNQTVVQSNNATFTASVTGLPTPVLQWFMNGTVISGAGTSSLVLTNVLYSQNGYAYSLVASNSAGMATNSATLTVLVPPAISQQPTNLTIVTGGPASFSITASGVPAVSYQWNLNGSPIAGATSPTYTIASAQGSENGAVFSVTVSNSVGVVTSSNATLTVLTASSEAFLPTNDAVNISPDQQLRIVFSGPPQLGSGNLYVYNAANNSLFAMVETSQFQTFSLFGATVTNAEVRVQEGESTYYMPIAIYGNQVWITLTNEFAYGGTYYVNCDAGLFLDASNNVYPAITGTNTWQFSIATSGPVTPTASSGPTNITVGLDGSGNFATLQGAANWIPQNNTLPRTITVLPGIYRDFTVFGQNRNNVMIVGAGANQQAVQFVYPYPAFSSADDDGFGDLRLESSNIYVRNLTLDNQVYFTNNGVVFAGPINTVYTSGNQLIFDNVLIKGGQDTLYTDSGITYFNHCEIWGSVDFIYGGALSVFDQCNIVEIRNTGGPCTAPSTPYAQPYGLTFLNCTFPQVSTTNGYPYTVGNATTTFMRPWRQDGMTAIINCQVGNQISSMGWGTFGNTNEDVCRAREYGTTLIGGSSVAVPQTRWDNGAYWVNTYDPDYTNSSQLPTDPLLAPPTGTNNRVVITINTNSYSLPAIYTNAYFALNGWLPAVIPTIDTQPMNEVTTNGGTVTFSVLATAQPSPVFQWLKNGVLLSGQTNTTLVVTNVSYGSYGAYSVIVSNSMGTVTSSNAWLLVSTKPAPPLPGIPAGTNNVLNFGAIGDGITTNTTAIQAAINAMSLAGGGTVEIPPGVYLSGPLFLSNSINFQIDAGAMLQMLPYGSFPATSDFISSISLHDVEVSGGGTIDGQGAVWWATNNAIAGGISRPKTMVAATTCTNFWLHNVTLQNPPNTHSSFRSVCQNVTVDGITINTTNPSPNTDGIDCSAANVLIENSSISDGDDHIAMGDGNIGNFCHDITIENCLFGNGHGLSIGSFTTGGLSNLLVLDCVWTNGGTGIKVKSDVDRGGLVQNLQYINLAMTNTEIPIYFFGYYTNGGTANGVTYAQAAGYPVFPVQVTTPIYNNILVSNLTAVPAGGYYAGIVWGRPEMCISNVVFDHVNIAASKYFNVYNARNIQFIDSQITASTTTNFGIFNAALIITNRSASANFNLVDGLVTNGYGNALSFYNAQASLSDTNALAGGPVSVAASTFTVSNNLAMTPASTFNFSPGTSSALVAVKGNLQSGGTVNISAGAGFTNGNYTILTYGGSLTGTLPTLGAVPSGFNYSINTNTPGQVKLVVSPMVNGTPTNLVYQVIGGTGTAGTLDVSWPADHTGWRLQIQTNNLTAGLGTNWFDVAGATATNQMLVPIDSRNGSVFLRLIYP